MKNNCCFIYLLISLNLFSQNERNISRNGNIDYGKGNFVEAEIKYKEAIKIDQDLMEAQFNLGDALIKQKRFDEAIDVLDKLIDNTNDKVLKSKAYHNKGNIFFNKEDYKSAL